MADFEIGQTFLDFQSSREGVKKPKYFIAMSPANYDDDQIVCLVMNTEHRMDIVRVGCNKRIGKFVLAPGALSFIKKHTSIMLSRPCLYNYYEMFESNIKLLDLVEDSLLRQIKNCIDFDDIPIKFTKMIKGAFKKN